MASTSLHSLPRTMRCYGQINTGEWCQEMYETSTKDAGERARQLRKAGYHVFNSALGPQVTSVGVVTMSMLTIRAGEHVDTCALPTEGWSHRRG